ncbi:MAG: hypothetical protein HYV01_11805 [Deltaproteobacteria bacterium]|nr:hypothetical protein [Deltaproteobacteria bacterium]
MQVVTAQVTAEQFVDIIQSTLTSDFQIAARQQLIKILPRIAMAKRRRGEDHIHGNILATAIQGRKPNMCARIKADA